MYSFKHTPLNSLLFTFLFLVVYAQPLTLRAQAQSDIKTDEPQMPAAPAESPGIKDNLEALLFQLHLKEQQDLDKAIYELNFNISSTSQQIALLENQHEELTKKVQNYQVEAEKKNDAAIKLLSKQCGKWSICGANSAFYDFGVSSGSLKDSCKSKECVKLLNEASELEAKANRTSLERVNVYSQISEMNSSLAEKWAFLAQYDEKYNLGGSAVKSALYVIDQVLSEADIGKGELLIDPEYSMISEIIPVYRIQPVFEEKVNEELQAHPNSLVSKVRLTNLMKVVLIAPTLSSQERAVSVQPISRVEPTQWSWHLTASDWGEHKVHVMIGAHLMVDGIETTRVIKEYDPKIVIHAHYPTIIWRFIKNNPEWAWSSLCIPFLAYGYRRFRILRSKVAPVKKPTYSDKLKGKKG